MKKITSSLSFAFLFFLLANFSYGQQVGDYGSAGNGLWGTASTWVVCQTTGQWSDATAASAAPSSSINVWIRSGHIVTVDASGKQCKNLTIQNSGQLITGITLPNSSIRYVRINGTTLQNDGNIGYISPDSSDAISFEAYGTNVTFQGSGTSRIARIRPGSSVATTTVTFDQDITMTYAGTSGTGGSAIYSSNSSSNKNIAFVLNSGRTLTCLPYAYIATSSSLSNNGTANTTFNINGTVNMGANCNFGLGIAAGSTCNLNVGSGGVVNIGQSLTDTTVFTGGTVNINVNAGGSLNCATGGSGTLNAAAATIKIDGTFDVGNSSTTIRNLGNATVSSTGKIRFMDSVVTIGGSLTLSPGATVEYYGTQAINLGTTIASYSNLTINNAAGVTLGTPTQISGILNLLNGTLTTSATNSLTLGASASISGGTATSFVNGPLTLTLASASPSKLSFQIGKDAAYRPVVLNVTQDAATSTTYQAEVINSVPTVNIVDTSLGRVSNVRYYTLSKGSGANITKASIQLSYNTDDGVSDPNGIRIAKDDGTGNWINLGGAGTTAFAGTITSATDFNSLGNFALGYLAGLPFPGVPVTVFPKNGDSNVNTTLALTWKRDINASSYEVQVSLSPLFTPNLVYVTGITDTSYKLTELSYNTNYYWRVRSYNATGSSEWTILSNFVTMKLPTDVNSEFQNLTFKIDQNYPNPFNPATVINYSIPKEVAVSIKVYNSLGKEIKTLENGYKSAGLYSITWNGDDNSGNKVSSGTYFYRITAGEFTQIKKMILLK